MDDEVILICGDPKSAHVIPGSVPEKCADCNCDVVRLPDKDVPEDATKLCWPCAKKRIDASGEPPVFNITKQNERHLRERGYKLKTEGNC